MRERENITPSYYSVASKDEERVIYEREKAAAAGGEQSSTLYALQSRAQQEVYMCIYIEREDL